VHFWYLVLNLFLVLSIRRCHPAKPLRDSTYTVLGDSLMLTASFTRRISALWLLRSLVLCNVSEHSAQARCAVQWSRLGIKGCQLAKQNFLGTYLLPTGCRVVRFWSCLMCTLRAAHEVSALRPTERSIREIIATRSTVIVLYVVSSVAADDVV
jgi:hypothetical protein